MNYKKYGKNKKGKILKKLEKYIKTCPECGKSFLGLRVESIHEYGDDYKHSGHNVDKYKLECGKCPKCQEQCLFNHEMVYTNFDLWHVTKHGIDLLIDYVKKFRRMPCSKEYSILEWYKDNKCDIKEDELFNDNNIKDYLETWLDYSMEGQRDICFCWLGESIKYQYDLIDLLDFFK